MCEYTLLTLVNGNTQYWIIDSQINANYNVTTVKRKNILFFNKFCLILFNLFVPKMKKIVTKYDNCYSNNKCLLEMIIKYRPGIVIPGPGIKIYASIHTLLNITL